MLPRYAWLRTMPYEVNVDEVTVAVTSLLFKDIDANAEKFNTYEIKKVELIVESSEPKTDKKRKNKRIEGNNG